MKNLLLNFRQFKALALVLSFIFGNAVVAMAQAPTITDFTPTQAINSPITITGTDLTGTNLVQFGSVSTTTNIIIVSSTEISVIVPAGATIGNLTVVTPGGSASTTTAFTPYVTWKGGNGNWDIPTNWGNNEVPNQTTNVIINSGTPVVNGAATCNNLTINNGVVLAVNAGATFSVSGLFVNSGTYNQTSGTLTVTGVFSNQGGFSHTGGTINFAAASGDQYLPALTYHNLTISGNGNKFLQGNTTVNGNLTFVGSDLKTVSQADVLTLNGSISGETVNRSFIGKLVKSRIVNGVVTDNFGNIGIGFVNSGGGNWGNVVATRITGQAVVNPTNASRKSINRYWIITPADENVNKNVQLTLTWFDSENNGLTFAGNQAQAWRKATGSAEWLPVDDMQTIAANGNERSITVNTTSFSSWAISDLMNPLPVSMTFFKGKATDAGSLLTWATASEKNSAAYEVERSLNGKDFEKVGTVRAAGNSNATLQYAFTDRNAAKNATNYYRLKMVDLDDTFEYSAIVMVNSSAKTTDLAVVAYPNPFNESLNLKLNNTVTNAEVTLTTIDGKQIYRQVIKEASPASDLKLNMPKLKPGFYLLNVMVDNKVTVLRVAQQ